MKGSKKDSKGRNLYENEDQQKDGRYRYRFTDQYGERRAIYSWKLVPTDKIPKGKRNDISLREKEKQVQKDLDDGINFFSNVMSVNDIILKYFGTKVNLAASTIENYRYMWKKDIKDNPLGNKRLTNVKKSDILYFYSSLRKRDFAIGTIQLYQNFLFPAFQMAVDDNIIRVNPCKGCMKDYSNSSLKSDKTPLTYEQEHNFMQFLEKDNLYSSRYFVLCSLMLGTGLRISEALGMTWDDVDLDAGCISVNHQIIYKKITKDEDNGKGKCIYYVAPPKNKDNRIIPLQSNLIKLLNEYKSLTYFSSLVNSPEIDGIKNFLFLNSNNNVHKPNTINRAFDNMRKKYNMEETEKAIMEKRKPELLPAFSPHTFRHTFCTRMAENGMDIKVLQTIMGHKTIEVTMQVYNHVNESRAMEEVKRIENHMKIAQ